MNALQQRALTLLDEIAPREVEKVVPRNRKSLLCSDQPVPSWQVWPKDWPGGWCAGWFFHIQPSLATALDIRLTEKSWTVPVLDDAGKPVPLLDEAGKQLLSEKGKPQFAKLRYKTLLWSQGSVFDFRPYTIHDVPVPQGEAWHETLQRIQVSLQIKEASPAVPATKETPRDPGMVCFQIHRPNNERTQSELVETRTVTQDDFVRILIVGLPKNIEEAQ